MSSAVAGTSAPVGQAGTHAPRDTRVGAQIDGRFTDVVLNEGGGAPPPPLAPAAGMLDPSPKRTQFSSRSWVDDKMR